MKTLSNQFSEYLFQSDYGTSDRPIQSYLREFYFATFGFNNEVQESKLLEYWRNN